MDALRAAAPLARALLSLADAKRSGVLRVQVGYRHAALVLQDGAATSLAGVDGELLGDTLMREGELDASRHGAALAEAGPEGPVGHWLVAVGAASREAVDRALVAQLERRLAALLRFAGASLRFEECSAGSSSGKPTIRAALAPNVWSGLLALASELTHAELALLAGSTRLRLTRAGAQFLGALKATGRVTDIDDLLHGNAEQPARAVLRALGFAVDGRLDADAFSLLLRKQREIRRQASAETLLDLPPSPAPDQARRALRRLAQKLHPDRFSGELPELRAISNEVMRALFRAEEALRGATLSRHVAR